MTCFPHSATRLGTALVCLLAASAGFARSKEAGGPGGSEGSPGPGLRFNRDIRPILSENCFHCHGQDASKRKADLRLDTREGATAALEGGSPVVPGNPQASTLLQRMESHDPDEQMPPPESHRQVTPEQIGLVRQWIREGAGYETHWAFVPPVRPDLPAEVPGTGGGAAWDRQPWDALVRQRLAKDGLAPSAEAAPAAWLRRVSFDLTGLGPLPEDLDEFAAEVASRGDAAYAAAADRLLASPRYGERMASDWMDVARYADTHGFNNDSMRSMWRWRDWVIGAFNSNLRYDQFLTKQLAGDLLPDATIADRTATGFGRNHVINSEGGIIGEEYRVEYVADRVRTLGMAWLGLTLECSRCHDHKYDPITSKDYYQLYAFFNQVAEWGEDGRVANAAPFLSAPTDDQQKALAGLETRIAETSAGRTPLPPPLAGQPVDALRHWLAAGTRDLPVPDQPVLELGREAGGPLKNARNPDKPLGWNGPVGKDPVLGPVISLPGSHDPGPWKLDKTHFPAASHKPWTLTLSVRWKGGEGVLFSSMAYDTVESSVSYGQGLEIRLTREGQLEVRMAQRWPAYAIQLRSRTVLQPDQWQQLAIVNQGTGRAAGIQLYLNGQESAVEVGHDGLSGGLELQSLQVGSARGPEPAPFRGELARLLVWERTVHPDRLLAMANAEFALLAGQDGDGQAAALAQLPRLQTVLRQRHPDTTDREHSLIHLERERLALWRAAPTVMVMNELAESRPTHVLMRGTYDAPGEKVTPGVPESLLGSWPEGAPRNRLGLAQWLVRPDQPLTARVVVNRFWQEIFGTGLVKTSEDFGFQSEYPVHPELLDWLARDFVDSGWNVKQLLKSIVLSATYRQDSAVSAALLAVDPENRLLARGPRVRLTAEMIRDQALAVSGLLRERIGGPSVYPDQPEELYKGIVVSADYPGTSWTTSTGDDRHRRSLYTFWKRTVPHPVMNVLDAPDRESGCVRRSRTNTPLQALTLMNEPSLLRAAGHLGRRIWLEGGIETADRLAWGFRAVTGREPDPAEAAALQRLLDGFMKSYQTDAAGAAALLKSGDVPVFVANEPAASAAWAAVAGTLLNLDETLTKN